MAQNRPREFSESQTARLYLENLRNENLIAVVSNGRICSDVARMLAVSAYAVHQGAIDIAYNRNIVPQIKEGKMEDYNIPKCCANCKFCHPQTKAEGEKGSPAFECRHDPVPVYKNDLEYVCSKYHYSQEAIEAYSKFLNELNDGVKGHLENFRFHKT